MSAPTTGAGLLILVLFLLPGAVYGLTFERLRGPTGGTDMGLRVLRALTVSTLLMAIYVIIWGPAITGRYRVVAAAYEVSQARGQQALVDQIQFFGQLSAILLFAIPVALAVAASISADIGWFPKLPLGFSQPVVPAWDQMFDSQGRKPYYVKVLTKDNVWYGGAMLSRSAAASFPHRHELFIERPHVMSAQGVIERTALPGAVGMWIDCTEAKVIIVERGGVRTN